MRTKRSQEAYVLIDHRNSPGLSPEFALAHGFDPTHLGAGRVFESAIAVCSHCSADVILNPNRSRPREWCMKCDAYMCDGCAAAAKSGALHTTYQHKLETFYSDIISGRINQEKSK
jgi:hypothetical protein